MRITIMRILVCGGRAYRDAAKLNAELDAIQKATPITILIHGAARGADVLAAGWAKSRGVRAHAFPANWNRYGKSAGYRRNEEMLRTGEPDLVVAFPGGKGTADMVRRAATAGIRVHLVA